MNLKKITISSLCLLTCFLTTNAAYYEPNSDIQPYIDDVNDKMTRIAASVKVNEEVSPSVFSSLESNFQLLKNKLPQKNEFKIIYQNCILASKKMQNRSKKTYKWDLSVFNSQCFSPWKDISRIIFWKYTVKPVINISPNGWNAPAYITFNWNSSRDPSADTIPDRNYYWYYKDSGGVQRLMWQWPVIKYRFDKENDYVVHLTVRSVNKATEWILDWSTHVTVPISPPIANISMYIEWKRASTTSHVKVSSAEWKRWVLFDASWTTPKWWTSITKTRWTIERDWSVIFDKEIPDDPKSVRVKLPENWYYFASLKLRDNTGKVLTQKYKVVVSNPVWLIRVRPESWTTSDNFMIDWSPSYSVNWKLTSYKWTLVWPKWNKIDSFSAKKSFNYNFNTPWVYSIKLEVEDVNWSRNEETYKLEIWSTPPVANFVFEKYDNREKPSTFIFDASYSDDFDAKYWDSIKYLWSITNQKDAKTQFIRKWEKMIAQFDKVWEYTVTLRVEDKYWKTDSIEKKINIISTLRPEVSVNPNYTTVWQPMWIRMKTNKTVAYYKYDYWDGKNDKTQSQFMEHTYTKAWVYNLLVSASSIDWDSNSILKKVFVWQRWYPLAIYEVYKWSNKQQLPSTYCMVKAETWTWTIPTLAYEVPRMSDFTIDAKDSVNWQWNKEMLSIYFKKQWENENILKSNISLKFDELWCQKITLYVKSLNNNKLDKKNIYFKVVNAPPILKWISMFFPQYGWDQWSTAFRPRIWNTQLPKNIFQSWFDPLLVKLIANWAHDPDSPIISYYRWYYYKKWDRSNLIDVKITPYNIPQMVFSLPRIPWIYIFGVDVCDEDGACTNSEDYLKTQPKVNIPPSAENPDIPQVNSVRIDSETSKWAWEVNVWDSVTINVNADVISKKDDFFSARTIKYDFDNDWKYDLTTKDAKVSYNFQKPWKYKVKVKVIYRWYGWIWYSAPIIVKKWLKPMVDLNYKWNTLIYNDLSFWNIKEKLFCFDFRSCKTSPADFLVKTKDYWLIKYPKPWKKHLLFQIKDDYWNQKTIKERLDIKESLSWSYLLTLPEASKSSTWYSIVPAWLYTNYIIWYYKSDNENCYIDKNISVDSNSDNDTTNDKDLLCNEVYKLKYENIPEVSLLINDGWEKTTAKIVFPATKLSMPQEYKEQYERIQRVIDKLSVKDKWSYLITLLSNLLNNLDDKVDRDSILLEIDSYIKQNDVEAQIKAEIESIISSLSDFSTNAAIKWNSTALDKLKSDVDFLLSNDSNKKQINDIFAKLKESSTKEERKNLLQELLNIWIDMKKAWNLDDEQLQIIKSSICELTSFYDIKTKSCWTELKKAEVSDSWSWSTLWKVLKIVMRVLAILVWIFILIVVIFIIKAKINKENEEETE